VNQRLLASISETLLWKRQSFIRYEKGTHFVILFVVAGLRYGECIAV